MLAASLALAAVPLGAGCGGASGPGEAQRAEESEIEALTQRFERIVAERDAEAFCEVLAPNDRHRLGGGESDGTKRCQVVWGPGRNPLFGARGVDLDVESVALQGTYATASLANGGKLAFAKEEGRWYVHLSPGQGQMR